MAPDSGYNFGHKESSLALMRFRTAERSCAFFREHVRTDSRILDCGCGPGSVTVGLAQWAPDGQTVGIDIGAEQLEGARALALDLGVKNVTFRQADIFALPFEDGSFDVVFSQTVFFHIPDHQKALAEIKRVLRPGGIIALRDVINASVFVWPEEPLIREVVRMIRLGAERSGGNPDVGLELGTLLHSAGFEDVFFALDFQHVERSERAEYLSLIAGGIEGDITALALREGWSTVEKLREGAAKLRGLANTPGSVFAFPYGQAIGRKAG